MATVSTGARSPQSLFDDVARYLAAPDVEAIRRAYAFAAEAHAPQLRESGEPYINHPLAVAETLASIHMDTATIIAALCHDVTEDCGIPLSEIESRFGREVARLVDGVTKLDKMQFLHVDGDESRPMNGQDLWAENMRKMFLAMAEDIRVVLIKLADRLHNMRTLQFRPPAKRRRVAQETMHIYSIYRKMQRRGVDVDQIYDQLAVRVLVQSIPDCYTALGVIHSIWRPLPGQFDDYIANPKESLYQSLHTTVLAVDGRPLEIHIRPHEMHQVAEYGVAAHWRYKEGLRQDQKFDAKVAWLRQLMDWQKDVAGGAQEFVDSLKTDIFQDQVYVFTPKGEIKELPSGATPLDFAYRIHTDVGHKCVGAKVNGRLVSLDTKLRNGDIVEIITAKGSRGPSRDWLNPNLGFVHTAHAREKIRQWFRRQQRDENIIRGRELVEKALKRLNVDGVKLDDLPKAFKYDKVDDFLAAVGYGDINPDEIGRHVLSGAEEQRKDNVTSIPQFARPSAPTGGLRVMGVGDL